MGFLDSLKSAAKSTVFQALNIEAEEEKVSKPTSNETYGVVSGSNIPENAMYSLDKDNNRIIIREFKTNKSIFEYSFDDVKKFELSEISEKDLPFGKAKFHHFTLTFNNAEEIKIAQTLTDYNQKTESNIKREKEESYKFFNIIHSFILNTKDAKTKNWLNTVFEDAGELPVFDEAGGYLADNIVANYDKHLQK
ncbi:MAG: hypothetical protein IJN93_00635 [Clostridia bacterium]|nr:hypothetical protein [Clostridia bacterium]